MRDDILRLVWVTLTAVLISGCAANPALPTPAPSSTQASSSSGGSQKVTPPDTATVLDSIKKIGSYIVWVVSTPNPPVRGSNTLQAVVMDTEGNAINDAQVSFDLNMTNMNMGRNGAVGVAQGSGRYASNVFFSMGGPWRVTVAIQRPGQSVVSDRFGFNVR